MDSTFGIREALVAFFGKRSLAHSKVRKAIWNSVLFHPLGARIAQKSCATRRAARGSHPHEGDGKVAH
jgi:hypothetical protein